MLIDLESAARLDQAPGSFQSIAWGTDTLTGGLYTAASDVQLVGRLMSSRPNLLSSISKELAQAMRQADDTARPTAKAALSHAWFKEVAG